MAALRHQLQAQLREGGIALFETHISFVLVTPTTAYKIKKAVNLGFLDATTLAQRRHGCEEELRLNRRLAPSLYLDVLSITGTPEVPALGGTGPAIEYAVQMRSFAQDGLWDRMAELDRLQPAHVDDLAAQLVRFHHDAAAAAPDSAFGQPEQVRAPMLDILADLERLLVAGNDQEDLARLRRWEADEATRLLPVFCERLRNGRVREGHGDLHLANVADIDGRTTVFDCIDFNAALRWIDVISDLAFMVMDLLAHGQPRLAHRLLNGYLESSGDYDGGRVLRYHIAYRALVRAKVNALRAAQAGASANDAGLRRYLELALAQMQPSSPVLMITHGPSGTGKTTLTQDLLEATGAVRIRADVERKRLFGLEAKTHSGSALSEGLYSAKATASTYARLCELAQAVLDGGRDVILDATFLRRAQRDAARQVAAAKGLRVLVLDFSVASDPAQLRQRVRERAVRGDDASEADTDVLEAQLHCSEPLDRDEQTWAWQVPPALRGTDDRLHVDWSTLRRRLGMSH